MDRTVVLKMMREAARPLGFQNRGRLFWKQYGDLGALVDLQSSRWGAGKYINVGLIPMAMVIKEIPPDTAYSGIKLRAPDLPILNGKQFDLLEGDHENAMDPEVLGAPIHAVFEWIDTNWNNPEKVRQQLLEEQLWPNRVWLFLRDWARGALKDPKEYFEGTPYYK